MPTGAPRAVHVGLAFRAWILSSRAHVLGFRLLPPYYTSPPIFIANSVVLVRRMLRILVVGWEAVSKMWALAVVDRQ